MLCREGSQRKFSLLKTSGTLVLEELVFFKKPLLSRHIQEQEKYHRPVSTTQGLYQGVTEWLKEEMFITSGWG
uniref:Uncharacterized protein n=1 Tax=Anguilla anguilla TaxID=7936 RepID=A0A0E9U1G0_ANGAN